jgi:hypothetical protein
LGRDSRNVTWITKDKECLRKPGLPLQSFCPTFEVS